MNIVKADKSYLEVIVQLFDLYRQFYGQKSDLLQARTFLEERFNYLDSVIFVAFDHLDQPLGFVQLYPSYSSIAMKRMWYLNDLFVVKSSRQQGVGKALLQQVKTYAKETNAITVKLATSINNEVAQKLYLSEGYSKVSDFDHFTQKVV